MTFFEKLKSSIARCCGFSDVVFLLSFVFVGGFYDYLSCLVSIALLTYLFIKIIKNKCFKFSITPLSIAVFGIVLFYGLSVFWAVDKGMAFVGFLKFLPILIYLGVLEQSKQSKKVLAVLPYFAAVLTAVSSVLSLVPLFSKFFLVAGRLSGFFQYPNTFALFILISILLICKKEKLIITDYIILAVLICGLLYTGSRAVFVLFIICAFLMLFVKASKSKRFVLLGVIILLVCVLAVFSQGNGIFARFLKIDFTQSTFVGRFLYMSDALRLLLKHPFGMGYFGYLYSQGAVQTGVYNVSFVHNDILQIALDAGILASALLVVAVIVFMFKKRVPFADKLIVAVFFVHNLFDFNLQFIAMFMLFILFLYDTDAKQVKVTGTAVLKTSVVLLAAVNVYMSIPLALSQFKAYSASDALYPYYTRNKLLLVQDQTDIDAANEIADDILKYNTAYYAPYSIKAKHCYSRGDFLGVMQNKKQVFAKNRFGYSEYEEYALMLSNGIVAYNQRGDSKSADVLKNELSELQKLLQENGKHISKLGSMIADKPVTSLPDNVLKYIDEKAGEPN